MEHGLLAKRGPQDEAHLGLVLRAVDLVGHAVSEASQDVA